MLEVRFGTKMSITDVVNIYKDTTKYIADVIHNDYLNDTDKYHEDEDVAFMVEVCRNAAEILCTTIGKWHVARIQQMALGCTRTELNDLTGWLKNIL